MALSAGLAVSVQVLIGSTWTSLSSRDVIQSLRIQYGLSSNGPTDCLAATGECEYTLRNDAGNSGGVAGLYSPLNSNVLSGWTFGLRQRVVFSYESPLTV